MIRQNIDRLAINDQCSVATADTFFWSRQFLADPSRHPKQSWAVFCSPPYELYVTHKRELLEMIQSLQAVSPPDSLFVVESDDRFDPAELPDADHWRIRRYAPAQICVFRPPGENR
jgi:16S rRNA G966 N2-methylase RsmD